MARRSKLAKVAGLGLLGALTLSGCELTGSWVSWGWPEGITDQAEAMHDLWIGSTIAALVVGIGVWALIAYATIRYRKRGNELPRQTAYNLPLEVVYTIIPFLIIAVLFFFTVNTQNEVRDVSEDPDVTVAVNAFKWNWQFVYPETETEAGEAVSTVGTSTEIPILVVPTDRTIRFELASADVIHSFWVPEFLFKLDIIPGQDNGRDNVFEVTVREEGAYVGRCAELCGTYHAFMNFELRSVTPDAYETYLEAREDGLSTYDALVLIDEPGNAVSTQPFAPQREQAVASDD
ncbi:MULTISPECIES: aa3-type cytochrome oxidase subunit II [unclassified Modestobacter]|uniref:aa3-type cytochrome oxidase subunit II n=1 Tax=unclassified Modestobacter TaxID=2643866 RepID=UPI0022AB071E|nr:MULTISPECIES: cytochrome c oxidase subunit II [unclassified Modestobacter]MCZ2824755.1 cytochrome c oxidase subunit II [Modestobacter sp. VKM Ac-2981]MCZ2854742.1 cytochrome c oxidase subunit II [Modestobacter sp. VKM Ac-2982]